MHKFPVFRAVASHFLALVVTAVMAFLVLDRTGALSVLAGALVSFVPGTLFTLKYFQYSGARAMERVVRNAYIAEMMKLVMMGLGFALVFRIVDQVQPLMVFVGFLVVHVASLVMVVKATGRRTV
ncbi:MAG TPA: ATP synthase subunit I [Candidatus Acidoferrum sp.]|nr:ATP synthase subunit I [Candidatus Acidoferrum sp.]